jgi:hypothetical protein
VDFEIGRVLRQVVDRKLYRELGFESFERYVTERLDLSPRTARRLVRLARAEHRAPEVATAFRVGRITQLQAEVLLRGGSVERAEAVTLRRLEDEVLPREVAFWGCWITRSRRGSQRGRRSRTTPISNETAGAARCPAARRGGTCRAITSCSGPRAGPTFPGTGRRSARSTTTGACTRGPSAFGGARLQI